MSRLRSLVLAVLAASSLALATGRAGWRAEAQMGAWSIRGYVEERLFEVAGLEFWAGLDVRLPEMTATPYTALFYSGDSWWVGLELARPVPGGGFRAALIGGWNW